MKAFILISTTSQDKGAILQRIKNEVAVVKEGFVVSEGEYDIILELEVLTFEGFKEGALEQIRQIAGICTTLTLIEKIKVNPCG